ncbi:phage portal protein [Raoultella terrigena]|uniref:phage portal protein n=1 Tax=Raoultella terrigena TaxID=577 RepID=UPI002DBD68C7|nr:phage portal protein [Raoultella terrigena]MEB7601401.1 phage portal protein [Raoultella terrigena]
MNERELSLIKAISEEFNVAMSDLSKSFKAQLEEQRQFYEGLLNKSGAKTFTPEDLRPLLQELVTAAVGEIPVPRDGKDYDPVVLKQAVDDAVGALPPAQDGRSVTPEDVRPLLQELVTAAVGEIPTPRDGKDYDPAVLKQVVDDAVAALPPAQDGRSVTPEDVRPLLQELVTAAVGEIPVPRDGKDYDPAVLKQAVDDAVGALPPAQDGRDALHLEIQPFIDEGKSYPRGSYATHNGGLWRAYEKTHGMRGWECIVDGMAVAEIDHSDQRCFTVTLTRTSGASETKAFDVPVMIYQGVFKSGQEYLPGDTVTWAGSLWHCDEQTQDKPGETGSKGWTLAAKRGRDGRDKA